MTAAELLGELKAREVTLVAEGGRLRYYPASRVPEPLVEELRHRKAEVLELVGLEGWPRESLDAVQRFGVPYARLFPLLNHRVETPTGAGLLLQVFAERVAIVLDSEPGSVTFFLPSEVFPAKVEGLPQGFQEEIH